MLVKYSINKRKLFKQRVLNPLRIDKLVPVSVKKPLKMQKLRKSIKKFFLLNLSKKKTFRRRVFVFLKTFFRPSKAGIVIKTKKKHTVFFNWLHLKMPLKRRLFKKLYLYSNSLIPTKRLRRLRKLWRSRRSESWDNTRRSYCIVTRLKKGTIFIKNKFIISNKNYLLDHFNKFFRILRRLNAIKHRRLRKKILRKFKLRPLFERFRKSLLYLYIFCFSINYVYRLKLLLFTRVKLFYNLSTNLLFSLPLNYEMYNIKTFYKENRILYYTSIYRQIRL